MAYDIGYDATNARPARWGWETWAQVFATVRRVADDSLAAFRPRGRAPSPRPLMVEDAMLRLTLVRQRPGVVSIPTKSKTSNADAAIPLAPFGGALLIWRRRDASLDGRNFTLSIGLGLGGRHADAAIILVAFSFSR